jgi:DNA-binding response OmpR family regulator
MDRQPPDRRERPHPNASGGAPQAFGGLPDDARGSETVLLVEDDAAVRRVAAEALRRLGYLVLHAATAEQAVRLADAHNGPIHLVLSDVVLPEVSGRELAERVQRLRPGVKVLYMSGYAAESIERHGVLDPGASCIEKPFTLEHLARQVRLALDG